MVTRWGRVGRGLGGLAATLVVAVAAWLVGLRVRTEGHPEPLYTAANIPASPPAPSNGWGLVQGSRPPELPRPLLELVVPGATTAADWALVERQAAPLRQLLAGAPAQATLTAFGAALDRPAFADACPVELFEVCPIVTLYRAHQLEELALLGRALDAPDEASQGLVRLLRADAGWLGTARSILSFEVAVASARRSLVVATLLRPRVSPESRSWLASGLEAVRQAPTDLTRPLAVEYLRGLDAIGVVGVDAHALRLADPTSHESSLSGRAASALWLDRGRTERLLADRTRAWAAWLHQPPTVAPPTDLTYAEQPFYWLENPVGKLTLDAIRLSPSLWPKVRLELGALEAEAAMLATALRGDEPGR